MTGGNTYNKFLVDVQETLSNKINKQFYILSFDVDNFKYINNFTGLPAAIRFAANIQFGQRLDAARRNCGTYFR